jgi:hypothetical protein
MKNSFLVLAIITLAFLSGCRNQACTVGQIKITDQDIEYRAKVSEIYYPGSGKRYVGLAQLIKGYLALAILKDLGHPADAAKIEAEAQRINTNTKAPETLRKIKDVFGENRQAYLNVFVKPAYAERVLYFEIFLKDAEIQREPRNQAEKFRQEALAAPAAFGQIAVKHNVKAGRLKVSAKTGIGPVAEKSGLSAEPIGLDQAHVILKMVADLPADQLITPVIEWPEGFQVVKLISKDNDSAIIDSVVIPKKSFDEWFWEKAVKIPVRINDQKLQAELFREVSWAKNLHF